jgi:hypothetical protein
MLTATIDERRIRTNEHSPTANRRNDKREGRARSDVERSPIHRRLSARA